MKSMLAELAMAMANPYDFWHEATQMAVINGDHYLLTTIVWC